MDEEQFAFAEEIVGDDIVGWGGINLEAIDQLRDVDDYSKTDMFKGLYGLDGQIRMLLNALYHAVRSQGTCLSHAVLQGLPACGKSSIANAVANLVGESSCLRVDATKTTRAGLERLFFNDLPVVPPLIIVEEIEKSSPDDLLIYLGMCDFRQEIRKITSRGAFRRPINSLVIATCNSSDKFEKLAAGALASRFSTCIHFPRPDEQTIRMILERYASDHGIEAAPIDSVMEISKVYNITDPRTLCSYLLQTNFDDIKNNMALKSTKRMPRGRKTDVSDLNNLILELERSDA